jgi:hypothetical protein
MAEGYFWAYHRVSLCPLMFSLSFISPGSFFLFSFQRSHVNGDVWEQSLSVKQLECCHALPCHDAGDSILAWSFDALSDQQLTKDHLGAVFRNITA